MSGRLRIHLADPAIRAAPGPEAGAWASEEGDLSVRIVYAPDGSAVSLQAERDAATARTVYYGAAQGDLFVADSFRDALACLPAAERRLDDAAIVDHLLFRTVPGERTYVPAIRRLGAGSTLRWDRASDEFRVSGPARIRATRCADPTLEVERFLEEELRAAPNWGALANLLSGGIDSTLIHTFLGPAVASVSVGIESPEFEPEIAYALEASRLLGTRHQLIRMSEDEWSFWLADGVRASALPPHHLQTALIHRALQADFDAFVSGQYADALFGLSASSIAPDMGAAAGWLKEAVARWGPRWALPAHRRESARLGKVDPADPRGFGATFAVYSDMELIERIFGREQVTAALQRRLEYALARVASPIPGGIVGHLHVGHWVDFFCDDTLTIWRQLAFERGRRLVTPFAGARAARLALSVPAARRYANRGRTKYLLKDALRRRLPRYEVDRPKGFSGLPLRRFVLEGRIRAILTQHGVPPALGPVLAALESEPDPAGCCETWWNVASLALWRGIALGAGALEPISGSLRANPVRVAA